MKEKTKSSLELAAIVLLFLFLSYLVSSNARLFKPLMSLGIYGMLIYLFLVVLAIVLAPVSTVPLIPVASKMWGWEISALLNIFGWTIGAVIAFVIARVYGRKLVKKIVPMSSLEKIEDKIPSENLFWSLVFLRMALPVDVLSYAVGLFTKMEFKIYALATFLGVIPFGIILSYIGSAPFYYQLTAILLSLVILYFGFRNTKKLFRKRNSLKEKNNP